MHRIIVDLPQPEGPMIAVSWLAWKSSSMSLTAGVSPKKACRRSSLRSTPRGGVTAPRSESAGDGAGGDGGELAAVAGVEEDGWSCSLRGRCSESAWVIG